MRRHVRVSSFALAIAVSSAGLLHGQSVDEIIANNLKAKGGVEALRSTTSVRMTGRMSSPQGSMTMTTTAKRPNLFRQEVSLGGQKMTSGFDGKTAWVMRDSQPAQEVKGPQAESARTDAEFDSVLLDYKEKGHTVELAGKETLDGKPVYHLRVVQKNGLVQQYFIDAQTWLERKISTAVDAPNGKANAELELSDYRAVEGRTVPFKVRKLIDGSPVGELTFDKIEFNVPVNDSMFAMPKS